jgi:hypothetical protein
VPKRLRIPTTIAASIRERKAWIFNHVIDMITVIIPAARQINGQAVQSVLLEIWARFRIMSVGFGIKATLPEAHPISKLNSDHALFNYF